MCSEYGIFLFSLLRVIMVIKVLLALWVLLVLG